MNVIEINNGLADVYIIIPGNISSSKERIGLGTSIPDCDMEFSVRNFCCSS